jgi:hypothetical protein
MGDVFGPGDLRSWAATVKNLEPEKPWDITFNLIKVDGASGKEELLKTFQFNPQTEKLSDAFAIWVKYRDQDAATNAAPSPSPTAGK